MEEVYASFKCLHATTVSARHYLESSKVMVPDQEARWERGAARNMPWRNSRVKGSWTAARGSPAGVCSPVGHLLCIHSSERRASSLFSLKGTNRKQGKLD